jgi:hypothetical protein
MSSGGPAEKTAAAAEWRVLLRARPLANAAAAVEPRPDGGVVIRVPRAPSPLRRAPWRWFVGVGAERRVVLDRVGAGVWGLCDGRRTVGEIVDVFAARHRLGFHESRTAVTPYLRELIRRGVLAIALPERPDD